MRIPHGTRKALGVTGSCAALGAALGAQGRGPGQCGFATSQPTVGGLSLQEPQPPYRGTQTVLSQLGGGVAAGHQGWALRPSERLEGTQRKPCTESNSSPPPPPPPLPPSLLPPLLWAPLLPSSRAGDELCRPKPGTSVSINPLQLLLGVITGAWGEGGPRAQVGPGEGCTLVRGGGGDIPERGAPHTSPPGWRGRLGRRAGQPAEQVLQGWGHLCAPLSSPLTSVTPDERARAEGTGCRGGAAALGRDRVAVQADPGAVRLAPAVGLHTDCAFSGEWF